MDHSLFFNTLNQKLSGNCKFENAGGKSTYVHYRANQGNEVQVNITTRFEPKNTVRIQLLSTSCPDNTKARQTTEDEVMRIEERLGTTLTPNHKPQPSAVSHNSDYTYYALYFPFVMQPMEVVDDVAKALIEIFNVLA